MKLIRNMKKKAQVCECGFHVCEHPLDLFKNYVPNQSNFCEVEQFDEILKEEYYSKLHSLKLKLKQKLV